MQQLSSCGGVEFISINNIEVYIVQRPSKKSIRGMFISLVRRGYCYPIEDLLIPNLAVCSMTEMTICQNGSDLISPGALNIQKTKAPP